MHYPEEGERQPPPPPPDRKNDPVGYLRWELTHVSPGSLTQEQIDEMVIDFKNKLEKGDITLDD